MNATCWFLHPEHDRQMKAGQVHTAAVSVVRARLGLEAAALARLAGLTACQNCRPGPGPCQVEPSPSRGLSPGLGKFGITVLKY